MGWLTSSGSPGLTAVLSPELSSPGCKLVAHQLLHTAAAGAEESLANC